MSILTIGLLTFLIVYQIAKNLNWMIYFRTNGNQLPKINLYLNRQYLDYLYFKFVFDSKKIYLHLNQISGWIPRKSRYSKWPEPYFKTCFKIKLVPRSWNKRSTEIAFFLIFVGVVMNNHLNTITNTKQYCIKIQNFYVTLSYVIINIYY